MKDKVIQLNERRIRAYSECPADISEHFGIEQTVLAGGYEYRQILELVQNGADAILDNGPPMTTAFMCGWPIRGSMWPTPAHR
ncbi:MAG: hypothetical protein ACHRXM_29765 [Isosphaerales bacterium]